MRKNEKESVNALKVTSRLWGDLHFGGDVGPWCSAVGTANRQFLNSSETRPVSLETQEDWREGYLIKRVRTRKK